MFLHQKQYNLPYDERNYEYIEILQKAIMNSSGRDNKAGLFLRKIGMMAERDYNTRSLRHINHLIQIFGTPNLELKEPRWEIYKIAISFKYLIGK